MSRHVEHSDSFIGGDASREDYADDEPSENSITSVQLIGILSRKAHNSMLLLLMMMMCCGKTYIETPVGWNWL